MSAQEYTPSEAEVEAAARAILSPTGQVKFEDLSQSAQEITRNKARAALTAAHAVVDMVPAARLAEVLTEARDDIAARRRGFQRLGAHDEYVAALDDAYGLVNNRLTDVRPTTTEGADL